MNRLRAVATVRRRDEGRRLVVRAGGATFDYFPQIGEWVRRGSGRRRRGLRNLIDTLRKRSTEPPE